MKKAFILWLLAAGLLVGASGMGNAQTPAIQNININTGAATTSQDNSNVVVLSGCLERGPGAGEYRLFGKNLHSWVLKSDNIYLEGFLAEEVKVAALETPNQDGTLTVIDLLVLTSSCSHS